MSGAASLANVLAFRLRIFADGLAIRHLWLADVGFHFVFTHHAVNDDFEMQFAHTADDGLSGIRIGSDFECRVFLGETAQRYAHFFLVALGLGFNRNRNHRLGELNGLEKNGSFVRANRVASGDVFHADAGADVPSEDLTDLFALVGVHLQQTADALGFPSSGIQYGVAGLEMSGVYAHECQLADKGVRHDFECQPGERFIIRGPARQFLFQMVRIVAFGRRNIQR